MGEYEYDYVYPRVQYLPKKGDPNAVEKVEINLSGLVEDITAFLNRKAAIGYDTNNVVVKVDEALTEEEEEGLVQVLEEHGYVPAEA